MSLPSPQKQEGPGETPAPVEKKEAATPEKDRKVEELRWQEVDERQTMPRPYTFQVSSGGRQILFPKVNLSPVTPVKDAGPASAPHEPKAPKASPASHALPLSLSIPHTAILVTGAQLCGPAVNLSQIKDTACKSLLGLSEEKKQVDVPSLENPARAPADPRAGSGKARPPQESPSSAAALAEWASIRSRILKNAEGDQHSKRDPSQPGDEQTPRGRSDSRGNLRKTPPGNAKFSIMPAWQKFSDGGTETSKQNTEAESIRRRPMLEASDKTAPLPPAANSNDHCKGAENLGVHQEPTDTTEGCKFAKDLPSFLVPSLPYPLQRAVAQAEPETTLDSETSSARGKADPAVPGGEEKASPFGIKLRRTNYSLRFHCDQQTEKKKKRHSSTGDGADGGPPAPGSTDGEKEAEGVALKHGPALPPERKQAPSTWEDSAVSPSSPTGEAFPSARGWEERKAGAAEQTLSGRRQTRGQSRNLAAAVDNVSAAEAEGLSGAAGHQGGEEASQGGQAGGKALQRPRRCQSTARRQQCQQSWIPAQARGSARREAGDGRVQAGAQRAAEEGQHPPHVGDSGDLGFDAPRATGEGSHKEVFHPRRCPGVNRTSLAGFGQKESQGLERLPADH
uniref:Uncharacterized protein n=1 Tax=Molossus molossus TaxID=27622 RepID=A0A7J8JUF2_MOLMO|nr:hypothetical protein HJG59_007260 [Molossus molossus]